MYRVKQLFGGSLTLRDYDGQVAEAMARGRALNKMTKAGMPESVRIAVKHNPLRGRLTRNLIYSTKPVGNISIGFIGKERKILFPRHRLRKTSAHGYLQWPDLKYR